MIHLLLIFVLLTISISINKSNGSINKCGEYLPEIYGCKMTYFSYSTSIYNLDPLDYEANLSIEQPQKLSIDFQAPHGLAASENNISFPMKTLKR